MAGNLVGGLFDDRDGKRIPLFGEVENHRREPREIARRRLAGPDHGIGWLAVEFGKDRLGKLGIDGVFANDPGAALAVLSG